MRVVSLFPSLVALVALACSPTVEEGEATDADTDTSVDTDVDTEPEPGPDLRVRGDDRAVTDSGSSTTRDCTLRWTRYSPNGQPGEALVILSHGFARGPDQMTGWAEHLASWGAEVVTPELCFASFINVDHEANGRTLADLATELGDDRPVILAGHSAGGLASTLAADELGDSVAGVLLLDPVDSDGLGAATSPSAPFGALFAAPSRCNADGNGTDMLPSGADAFDLAGATHCTFEDPTDGVCTAVCGGAGEDPPGLRRTVLGLTTGFVHWRGALDPRGQDWWTPGSDKFDGLDVGVTAR